MEFPNFSIRSVSMLNGVPVRRHVTLSSGAKELSNVDKITIRPTRFRKGTMPNLTEGIPETVPTTQRFNLPPQQRVPVLSLNKLDKFTRPELIRQIKKSNKAITGLHTMTKANLIATRKAQIRKEMLKNQMNREPSQLSRSELLKVIREHNKTRGAKNPKGLDKMKKTDLKRIRTNQLKRRFIKGRVVTRTHHPSMMTNINTTMSRFTRRYLIPNTTPEIYYWKGVEYLFTKMEHLLKNQMKDNEFAGTGVKVQLVVRASFISLTTGQVIENFYLNYDGNPQKINSPLNIPEAIDYYSLKLYNELENLENGPAGSEWVLRYVHDFDVMMIKQTNSAGGTYFKVPQYVLDTISNGKHSGRAKAILNVQNKYDNKCFKWSILAKLFYRSIARDRVRVTKYDTIKDEEHGLDFSMLSYPTPISEIEAFEEANKDKVAINVFQFYTEEEITKDRVIRQVYQSRNTHLDQDYYINLILLEQDDKYHYCLLVNRSQLELGHTSARKNNHSLNICDKCGRKFGNSAFEKHKKQNCATALEEGAEITFPKKEERFLKFKKWENQYRFPLVLYMDFETQKDVFKQLEEKATTRNMDRHIANSYCFKPVTKYNNLRDQLTPIETSVDIHSEEALFLNLFNDLKDVARVWRNAIAPWNAVPLEGAERAKANEAFHHESHCYMCKEILGTKEKVHCQFCDTVLKSDTCKKCPNCDKEVNQETTKRLSLRAHRDHDHFTGKFLGIAHAKCNWRRKFNRAPIPVFCHNMRGYDSHLILKHIHRFFSEKMGTISIIPHSAEKYLCFTVTEPETGVKFCFKDSMSFMSSGLADLTYNLAHATDIPVEKRHANLISHYPEHYNLLTRKGLYPYEAIRKDNLEVFDLKGLPKERWFNSEKLGKGAIVLYHNNFYEVADANEMTVKIEAINGNEKLEVFVNEVRLSGYRWANYVYENTECESFMDYHKLYLETDVLHLADVFEAFRNTLISLYELDPVHYFTTPNFGFDAMLKYCFTNADDSERVELLTDPEMFEFFESQKRGGLSMARTRFAKANNPECPNYNAEEAHTWISYVDANSLYGWAMVQYLPLNNFNWLSENEIENLYTLLKDTPHEDELPKETGYALEVDLKYPKEIHDKHSQYPLIPLTRPIGEEELSQWQKNQLKKMNKKFDKKSQKLVADLNDKKNVVMDIRYLKMALRQGLVLEKIHRGVKYTQKEWLKPFIELNTRMRTNATNDFEKDLYKLMCNSVYGKTLENVRKRTNADIFTFNNNQVLRADLGTGHRENKYPERILQKRLDSPFLMRVNHLSENLLFVEQMKKTITANKPIAVGGAVLDLSKLLMNQFYYDYIIPKFGYENVKLTFTDTDSLCLHIRTPDIYQSIKPDIKKWFDTSNFPKDHPLYYGKNKKQLGYFKFETGAEQINEIVCLMAKLYGFETTRKRKFKMTAKGISKKLHGTDIKYQNFTECVTGKDEIQTVVQTTFRSEGHQLLTQELKKKSLVNFDSKAHILDDGVNTLPFHHWRISEGKENELYNF